MFTGGITWMAGPIAGKALAAYRADGPGEAGLPAMPGELADLLERCLRLAPADRPGSMAEVATGLAEIHQRISGSPYPRATPVAADLRADEFNNRGVSLFDLERGDLTAARALLGELGDEAAGEPEVQAALRTVRSGRLIDARCAEARAIPWALFRDDELTEPDGPYKNGPYILRRRRRADGAAPGRRFRLAAARRRTGAARTPGRWTARHGSAQDVEAVTRDASHRHWRSPATRAPAKAPP